MNVQKMVVRRIALAVLEAIDEAGPIGAPSGILYAALMGQGCTLQTFKQIMDPMEAIGYVELESDCYLITAAGIAFMNVLKAQVGEMSAAAG